MTVVSVLVSASAWAEWVGPQRDEQGRIDIRELAPYKPKTVDDRWLVAPTGGNNFDSISQNWLQHQTTVLVDGADQRLVERLNRNLYRWFGASDSDDSAGVTNRVTADAGSVHGARTPASISPNAVSSNDESSSSSNIAPLHFAQINRLEMGVTSQSHLSCLVKGDSIQMDYSHRLNERLDLSLRHQSKDSSSSLQLNLKW